MQLKSINQKCIEWESECEQQFFSISLADPIYNDMDKTWGLVSTLTLMLSVIHSLP